MPLSKTKIQKHRHFEQNMTSTSTLLLLVSLSSLDCCCPCSGAQSSANEVVWFRPLNSVTLRHILRNQTNGSSYFLWQSTGELLMHEHKISQFKQCFNTWANVFVIKIQQGNYINCICHINELLTTFQINIGQFNGFFCAMEIKQLIHLCGVFTLYTRASIRFVCHLCTTYSQGEEIRPYR